jgi:4-amino-4-deoxy-L-arabinose transferase-like glycosyltransferase
MLEVSNQKYLFKFFALAVLITAIKLASIYFFKVNLWVDEAQYWTWSKELATGYFSKPPFIAWLIASSTNLIGDSAFGIRFFAPFTHLITAIFIYLIAQKFYNQKVAFYSSIFYITMPAVALSSSFISADAPLIMFWAGALYFLISAEEKTGYKKLLTYLFYAIFVGLGLLSKYTFGAFLLMSFAYIFYKYRLKAALNYQFWFANFIAFLIFLPNLIWNYNNDFISFRHTSENVVTGGAAGGLKLIDMLEFVGSQLAVFGLAFAVFFYALFKCKNKLSENNFILILFSFPLLLIGILISLTSGAQAHWAAPAYVAATIFTISFIIESRKALRALLIFNLIFWVLSLNINFSASIAAVKKDPLKRVNMWYQPAEKIKELAKTEKFVMATDERKIIAPLMFALKDKNGNPAQIYKINRDGIIRDHYDLTKPFKDDGVSNILFITRTDIRENLAETYFYVQNLAEINDKNPFYLFLVKGRR